MEIRQLIEKMWRIHDVRNWVRGVKIYDVSKDPCLEEFQAFKDRLAESYTIFQPRELLAKS